ncbi:Carboxylic ester hydrolase protein [Rutstroemia sp. NJR-2017a WRK4]|nr:Carboxylic ester hydrolase protein [Rutstroemia sp. NJR-2017a WRK4]PQE32315.1 Carboxylic ester hydrolase protein [Rutstroemia sp. NJR-2017a WRK4]
MLSNSKPKSTIQNTWFIEIISYVFCVISFGVVIVIIKVYNQQPIFNWHGISLNTWVSVFTTISEALLMLTVSACLSQWNYISFSQRPRNLLQFDTVDNASRGPKGSLSLLWFVRLKSLVSIGAGITVLAIAIDPFVQQIIGFGERQVAGSSNSTSIARAVRYSRTLYQTMSMLPLGSTEPHLY